MRKIMVVAVAALLLLVPAAVIAQEWTEVKDEKVTVNEFFAMGRFISLKPVNDFLANNGFGSLGDNPMMYGVTTKNKAGDKVYWGLSAGTTIGEGIFNILAPNLIERNISRIGTDTVTNRAEFNMMFAKGIFEYEIVKLGGFSVAAGMGIGFGGASITVIGDNGGRYRKLSFLVNPVASAKYHFFEESGGGVIVSFTASYDYYPNIYWWPAEAGTLPQPDAFDMTGASVWVSVGIPVTEIKEK